MNSPSFLSSPSFLNSPSFWKWRKINNHQKSERNNTNKRCKLLSLEFCRAPHWWHQCTPNSIIFKEKVPGGSVVKNPTANAGGEGSIPGLGRSPEEGNSSQLQYSCLGNAMDRGAWWATVHRVARVGHNLAHLIFIICKVKVKVAQSCPTLLRPPRLWPARLLCPWHFPGKNTCVGCHFFLQGIFLTHGLNLHLLPWPKDSWPLSHQGRV